MKKITITSSFVLGMMAFPALASATVFFSEDFNSYVSGDPVPLGTDPGDWKAIAGDVNTFKTLTDSSDFFGAGTSNQFGSLSTFVANTKSLVSMNSLPGNPSSSMTGQFSMQFYDPIGAAGGDGQRWGVRLGGYTANAGTMFTVFFDDGNLVLSNDATVNPIGGTITTYDPGVAHQLDIVFNNQASDVYNYAGGTVAAGYMDVYLNGVLVGDDLAGNTIVNGIQNNTVKVVEFLNKPLSWKNPVENDLYVDNLILTDSVAIPEPGVFSLLAGGLGLLAAMSRRTTRRR